MYLVNTFVHLQQWDGWQAASLYQQANLCVWAVILAILTYQKIMSAYLPCLLMTGPLHSWILSRCLGKDFKGLVISSINKRQETYSNKHLKK